MIDELDDLEARTRVHELLDELGIVSNVLRGEMTDDPERAIAVLEHARRAPRIRNAASFAIARWRAGADPRARAERSRVARGELERAAPLDEAPPMLEALELAWHLEGEGSIVAGPVLTMMRAAIERAGGCRAALYRAELFGD